MSDIRYNVLLLKAVCLLAMVPALSGCVLVYGVFMRNSLAAPVRISLVEWRRAGLQQSEPPRYWRYAPRVLPKRWASVEKLNDSLLVVANDTAITFELPAHSTVLIGIAHAPPHFKTLYLQRANAPAIVLDSTQILQAFRYKVFKSSFWYDVSEASNY